MTNLVVEPRDAAIFRDGKPFSVGLSARSIGFCPPSVAAGSIRTRLGTKDGYFDSDLVGELLKIEIAGPLLGYRNPEESRWRVSVAAPADIVAYDDDGGLRWHKLRPGEPGGSDIPNGMLPLFGATPEKPAKQAPTFWKWETLKQWLQGICPHANKEIVGFNSLPRQRRVHVKIAEANQTAEEGKLFSTEGLEFEHRDVRFGLVLQYSSGDRGRFAPLSHIGGESRTAYWHPEAEIEWPAMPGGLEVRKKLRLILATPAIFKQGWKPGWLGTDNIGTPPLLGAPELKLVAAAVPRALAISGWDYKLHSPKATRLAVPAGSVYFFEVIKGEPEMLWMNSICDDPQDQLDGFGRVFVGTGDWQ